MNRLPWYYFLPIRTSISFFTSSRILPSVTSIINQRPPFCGGISWRLHLFVQFHALQPKPLQPAAQISIGIHYCHLFLSANKIVIQLLFVLRTQIGTIDWNIATDNRFIRGNQDAVAIIRQKQRQFVSAIMGYISCSCLLYTSPSPRD